MTLPDLLAYLSNTTRAKLYKNYDFKICILVKSNPNSIHEDYKFSTHTQKKATNKTGQRFQFLYPIGQHMQIFTSWKLVMIYVGWKKQLFHTGRENQTNVREKVLYESN